MRHYILAAGIALLSAGIAHAAVTEEDVAKDATTTGDVVTNGMGRSLQRFSPLDKINKDTVGKLVPVWAFSLGGESSAARRPSRWCATASCT